MAKYGITSKSQIIDYMTISRYCDKIEEIAVDFKKAGDDIKQASNDLTIDVFSVEGKTYQPVLEELAQIVASYQDAINSSMESIRSVASSIKNEQNQELIDYNKSLEKNK